MSYKITASVDADGRTVLRYHGDAQDIVDQAAAEAREHREYGRFSGISEFRKVMELDPVVMMDVAMKNGLDFYDPRVVEIMKGRDYSKFRCVDDKLLFGGRRRSR